MSYWEYEEDKKLKDIEYAKSLYDLQTEKVKQEKYIEQLLLEDYVRKIKQNISRYDLVDLFRTAQDEMNEKLKKNRKNFETLKSWLMDDFLSNDYNFKLTSIVSCGYENYAWSIEFEGYGKTFRIEIPIMKNLTVENIGHAHDGMFAFVVKESEVSCSTLAASYKINDVSDFIREYFELDKVEE
jgi:hypothetical protein